MIDVIPLLFAAALVGILHMSAPDHWVTLVILGRTAGWNRSRLLGVALITGIGHVVLSIVLGFAVIILGLLFSQLVSFYFTEAIGLIMIIAGLYLGVKGLRNSKVADYEKQAEKERGIFTSSKSLKRGASYFAVLGAALSPDLSILPIFLIAVPVGIYLAFDTALIFAIASILTIILLVYIGSMGLARTFEKLPAKYNDALVGFVIAAVGVYILIVG